jgi:hypothetical protein
MRITAVMRGEPPEIDATPRLHTLSPNAAAIV